MKKLVDGIVEFRQKQLETYRAKFAVLARGQFPDALFIACSDSRVVPNTFASTDPGDLFVIRNVGNLIPPCGHDGHSSADESEAAAIEFAVMVLNVSNIIVCGHSDCGAMHALIAGREKVQAKNLRAWLRHGEPSLRLLPENLDKTICANHLSKLNVLQQIEHLRSYPVVRERIDSGSLKLHGWWFDLATADVYCFEESHGRFVVIDEEEAERIKKRLSSEPG
jgi:carbonic anhydrase